MEQIDQRELARAMNEKSNELIIAKGSAHVAKAIRDSAQARWMSAFALLCAAISAAAQLYPLIFR